MGPKEFAIRTGKPEKTIFAILGGKSSITPEMAVQFEHVLRIPAHYWLNMQRHYDEFLARQKRVALLPEAVAWASNFPVLEMMKKGWMPLQKTQEAPPESKTHRQRRHQFYQRPHRTRLHQHARRHRRQGDLRAQDQTTGSQANLTYQRVNRANVPTGQCVKSSLIPITCTLYPGFGFAQPDDSYPVPCSLSPGPRSLAPRRQYPDTSPSPTSCTTAGRSALRA